MPRFFQHIERPKEDALKKMKSNFGEVTRLKYIDDISDPDMIMYYFEDGTYCNRDYIAQWDEQNPLTSGKAMIEIVNPTSIWKFKERRVKFDIEDKVATGPDGQIYHGAMPENITTDELGRPIKTDHGKPGQVFWDVERAPYRPEKYEVNDDAFMLSIHPDLESGAIADESAGATAIVKNKKPATITGKKKQPVEISEPEEENFTLDDDFDFNGAVSLPPNKAKKALSESMSIPSNIKNLLISLPDGYDVNMSIEEILNAQKEITHLKEENEKLKNSPVVSNPGARYMEGEDVLIKNMIEKSKTKSCKISLKISMELPPKELYDTIKLAYPEGMTEQFVSSLTARISLDKLLDSLNGGLARYYEGESAKKKIDNNSAE